MASILSQPQWVKIASHIYGISVMGLGETHGWVLHWVGVGVWGCGGGVVAVWGDIKGMECVGQGTEQ